LKTVAIIQARVRSSRLPGKVLASVAGHPMLWHVVRRVCRARRVDQVVVATSTHPADDVIAEFCRQTGIHCTRGSETDVLDRYHQAAHDASADVIVRITADCPLIDPAVIDAVAAAYQSADFDYVSNIDPPTYPDGLDAEAFGFKALQTAWSEARLPSEREHVTPYLRNHPERFRTANVAHAQDLSHLRWTVDTLEDLAFVRAIRHALNSDDFSMEDVCRLLTASPSLCLINGGQQRNEGYQLSLQQDNLFTHALTLRQAA
jgi:spore coat polysaccharide biosynthesis protein SpsF (cytidylyltransferase family)